MEMKNDVSRLPTELGKLPSVSAQLKMDEISIISKLAKTQDTPSVITQAPPTNTGSVGPPTNEVLLVNKPAPTSSSTTSKYTIVSQQPGPQVQLPGQQVAVQTPEGLVMPVYSVAASTKPAQSVSVVQAAAPTVPATTTGQTIAIGVPTTYLEGSNVYQMQLLPTVSGQQMMYWPPVVASGQAQAQVTTVAAAPAPGGAGPSQLTVVQGTSPRVLQPVLSVASTGGGGATVTLATAQGQSRGSKKTSSIITID